MRIHPPWRIIFASQHRCKLEWSLWGYDIDCNGNKYLVRELHGNKVSISLTTWEEAKKLMPGLIVVVGASGKTRSGVRELARFSFTQWSRALMNWEPLEANGKKIYVVLKGGNRGKRLEIVVRPEAYRKWVELLRRTSMDEAELFEEMLRCAEKRLG